MAKPVYGSGVDYVSSGEVDAALRICGDNTGRRGDREEADGDLPGEADSSGVELCDVRRCIRLRSGAGQHIVARHRQGQQPWQ